MAENSGAEITGLAKKVTLRLSFERATWRWLRWLLAERMGLEHLRETGVQLLEALPQREKENDPEVLSSLVSIRLQLREMEQAREFARRATEVQPDSGFASLNLALALQNKR